MVIAFEHIDLLIVEQTTRWCDALMQTSNLLQVWSEVRNQSKQYACRKIILYINQNVPSDFKCFYVAVRNEIKDFPGADQGLPVSGLGLNDSIRCDNLSRFHVVVTVGSCWKLCRNA